jgi:hypothetical protein
MIANSQQKHLIYYLVAFIAVMTVACSLKTGSAEISLLGQTESFAGIHRIPQRYTFGGTGSIFN